MNKWLEYIKLFPEGAKNPRKVIEGIVNSANFVNLSEEEQDVIIARRILCASCPNMSANKEEAKKKGFDYCTLCSCPIETKTASLSSDCGAKYYNEKHPEDEQLILWEKYIKK